MRELSIIFFLPLSCFSLALAFSVLKKSHLHSMLDFQLCLSLLVSCICVWTTCNSVLVCVCCVCAFPPLLVACLWLGVGVGCVATAGHSAVLVARVFWWDQMRVWGDSQALVCHQIRCWGHCVGCCCCSLPTPHRSFASMQSSFAQTSTHTASMLNSMGVEDWGSFPIFL